MTFTHKVINRCYPYPMVNTFKEGTMVFIETKTGDVVKISNGKQEQFCHISQLQALSL